MALKSPTAVSERFPRVQPDPLRGIDALFQAYETSEGPGLAVGVRWHDRVIYRRGFGLANIGSGLTLGPTTRMRIASVSKQFTALACLHLAADARLNLDAPVGEYLRDLSSLPGQPTVRQFLSHTSGLRCTLEMGTLANGLALQPRAWQREALARQRTSQFEPGRAQLYCNGTYHVLSDLIEAVSGIGFEEYLTDHIFQPLGLHDTESISDPSQSLPRFASFYIKGPNEDWQLAPIETELRGDGGVVSTVDDLLRWLQYLRTLENTGLPEAWRALIVPTRTANGAATTYTLGLKRHEYRGVGVLHHSGGLIGLSAQILTVPAHALDIVIITNGAPVSAPQLSWQIVDLILAETLAPAIPLASANGLRHLGGRYYRGASGMSIGFDTARVDGLLAASLFHLPAVPFLRDNGKRVSVGFEDLGMGPYWIDKASFAPLPDGSPPSTLTVHTHDGEESLTLLPTEIRSEFGVHIQGQYFSEVLQANAVIEGDATILLQGDYGPRRTLALRRLTDTEAVAEDHAPLDARYALTFEAGSDGIRGFWLDTHRARRIWFQRVEEVSVS